MATHEVAIELTESAKEVLVEQGFDPAMGARPLRRAIQRHIEDPLADFVLGRELTPARRSSSTAAKVSCPARERLVDIRIVEGEPVAEKVTVPPEEPAEPEEAEEASCPRTDARFEQTGVRRPRAASRVSLPPSRRRRATVSDTCLVVSGTCQTRL